MEERTDRYRGLLTIVLLVLVAAGAVAWILRRPETRPLEIVSPSPSSGTREGVVKVYVSGEVVNPGVYAIREGDRVEDALKAAGGFTDQADKARINLAARVKDQQHINVPRVAVPGGPEATGEDVEGSHAPAASAGPASVSLGALKVNLNTASAAELDALPGIGPVTIKRIIDHREQVGPFQSVDELRDARLVDRGQFEKIKDLVTAP